MDMFWGLLVSAILLGCTYTLVAIGYCLFFGVLDVVVFCCGDIAIFGAFSIIGAYTILYSAGIYQAVPPIVAIFIMLAVAALLCAVLGLITYRLSIKPFERSSTLMPLLSTIAMGVVIKEILGLVFQPVVNSAASAVASGMDPISVVGGRNPQAMPRLIAAQGTTNERNIIIIAVMLVILVALFLFLNKTKMGLSMQAISQNKELALMTGVNVKSTITWTFVIGGILLSVGGFLLGNYQTIVRFDGGTMYGSKGFSAAVVGGLKNTWGAVIGGMLLGFVEVFTAGYISGGTRLQNIIAFLVVIIFIVFKPEGIIGEKTVEKV
ncbi:MAG: branched-chain amino acid ABC transporter permease [Clostridia bacterium]|nr:branched-chain amino acid ABC transporter permease [Candidatus Pelethousia sp.]NCB30367.1 branched-chain amino acid ABC transporter permease [Clostridia bacterium]